MPGRGSCARIRTLENFLKCLCAEIPGGATINLVHNVLTGLFEPHLTPWDELFHANAGSTYRA